MNSTYIDKKTQIHIQAHIYDSSVVGHESSVGANSIIQHSIIGPESKIGKSVKITNSIIHSNVEIEDDVTITNSIVQAGSILKSSCTLESGTMLAENISVKSNAVVPTGSLVSLQKYDSDEKKFTNIAADD